MLCGYRCEPGCVGGACFADTGANLGVLAVHALRIQVRTWVCWRFAVSAESSVNLGVLAVCSFCGVKCESGCVGGLQFLQSQV
jgi:hypothetical protein